jgi:hypothetical protein
MADPTTWPRPIRQTSMRAAASKPDQVKIETIRRFDADERLLFTQPTMFNCLSAALHRRKNRHLGLAYQGHLASRQ